MPTNTDTRVWIPNSAPVFRLVYGSELKLIIDWDNVLTDSEVIQSQTFTITPYKSGLPNLSVNSSSFTSSTSSLTLETVDESQLFQRFILTINIETSDGEVNSRSCYIKVMNQF